MTFSIDQALVTQFSDMVYLEAQQMDFRFAPAIEEIRVKGKDYAVERLGDVEAIEINTRHADTIAQDVAHSRRRLAMREFRTTILLDDFDDVSTLIDPQRGYVQAIAAEMNRVKDRLVAQAAFADVQTGRTFGTTVTFANDGGKTVVHGSAGLTYEKLLEVQENFVDNDVDTEREPAFIAITGQQSTNLMTETELTSGDFNREYAIEGGRVTNANGLRVLRFSGSVSNPVIGKVGANRECIALAKGGIVLGISKDMELKINERPDKNNALQLQACFYGNAVRRDAKKVQKVEATES